MRVLLRDARELEGVAREVGGVLHLGALVVVGEDHDVALGGEAAEFLLERGEVGHGVTGGRWRRAAASPVGVKPDYTLAASSGLRGSSPAAASPLFHLAVDLHADEEARGS